MGSVLVIYAMQRLYANTLDGMGILIDGVGWRTNLLSTGILESTKLMVQTCLNLCELNSQIM